MMMSAGEDYVEIDGPTTEALLWQSTLTVTLHLWCTLGGEQRLRRVFYALRGFTYAAMALPFESEWRGRLLEQASRESAIVQALRPHVGARGMGAA